MEPPTTSLRPTSRSTILSSPRSPESQQIGEASVVGVSAGSERVVTPVRREAAREAVRPSLWRELTSLRGNVPRWLQALIGIAACAAVLGAWEAVSRLGIAA